MKATSLINQVKRNLDNTLDKTFNIIKDFENDNSIKVEAYTDEGSVFLHCVGCKNRERKKYTVKLMVLLESAGLFVEFPNPEEGEVVEVVLPEMMVE